MKTLTQYLTEKKNYDPSKAETALEIETEMNNGNFIVTNDTEFRCPKLSGTDLEDLEEAIHQYWDDGDIDWLKLTRKGDKFKIETEIKK